MSVTGVGFGTQYFTNSITAAKQEPTVNTQTKEMQKDTFTKKHHKQKNVELEVVGQLFLTAAAVFGLIKGRGHIKSAFKALKTGAGKAFNYVKGKELGKTAAAGAKKAASAVKNGCAAVKEKVTSSSFTEKIKTGAKKAAEAAKTASEK